MHKNVLFFFRIIHSCVIVVWNYFIVSMYYNISLREFAIYVRTAISIKS
jgi:hypothetical protein